MNKQYRHLIYTAIKIAAQLYPSMMEDLGLNARWIAATPTEYKTYDYFLSTLQSLVRSVYNGLIGGDFVTMLSSLIQGQIIQAVFQAWEDSGGDGEPPEYLKTTAEGMIIDQQQYAEAYYRDIVDARVDETPIEPLLSRAALWAQNWNNAYNEAVRLIAVENGQRLEWVYAPEKEHCHECKELNGIVAFASEWDSLDVKPGGYDNWAITCKGYNCGCELKPTKKRRSPKAYDTILNIVTK